MIKCSICGKEENEASWANKKDLIKYQMCFNCNFWREQIQFDKTRKGIIIDNSHYVIKENVSTNEKTFFCGFGGKEFKIKLSNGNIIKCNNLWHQGQIPSYWLDKFECEKGEFVE